VKGNVKMNESPPPPDVPENLAAPPPFPKDEVQPPPPPGEVPTNGEKPPRRITRRFRDSDVVGRKRVTLDGMHKVLFGDSPLPGESDKAVTEKILAVPIEEQRWN